MEISRRKEARLILSSGIYIDGIFIYLPGNEAAWVTEPTIEKKYRSQLSEDEIVELLTKTER